MILQLESFISRNIRKYKFFIFELFLQKRSIVDVWQCSEYPTGFMNKLLVLNTSGVWYIVNRKHSELMLSWKKSISSKSKVYISHLLCPYYRYIWGKCKDLQRKGKVSQVFCLGVIVTIRVTENGLYLGRIEKNTEIGETI